MTDLESLLDRAAQDPGQRPAFYLGLLEAQIFALGNAARDAQGNVSALNLQHWGKPDGSAILPFFTSLMRLRQAISEEQSYVELPARAFLEATRGESLILNPNTESGKEFTPAEITALLDGTLFQQGHTRVIEEERQVLLGQPANYPAALVEALNSLFETLPEVKAAWLTYMNDPQDEAGPHLVFGLEVAGGEAAYRNAAGQAGRVANDVLPGEIVDFTPIGEGGMTDYFREQVKPFYQNLE
ncbi:MAG: enhanced serine sensitivity protein SseB C-terminal domain-containing protein [Chloroflexi bacterium]|nr:enhanced serine sensitivity protein SseB C-terminal domain-containing protein [Chloroflexota bacterium]